ncbi:MAG: flavin reductase family protein [Gammaproteobacteria bacterium]|nr:flavin reductase family protein [Gammaproteobacteria bacterium]
MRYDLSQIEKGIAYKLLAATITPRPIAWIVTKAANGSLNAAPYSFFNAMGSAPPTVAIGLLADPNRGFKDTARNILDTGEFVVNLVPERLVERMNITALNAPSGIDELELAQLETSPSKHIAPPRITDSPVSFECKSLSAVVTGPQQTVVIGEVLAIHVDDSYLLDAEKAYVDTPKLDLVARSYGSEYIRTKDRFSLDRPFWDQWKKETDTRKG